MDDLYSENIVDHYKNPRNFGEMENPTYEGRGANASCGDMIEFYVRIQSGTRSLKTEDRVEDVRFRGIGCALSTASASMLTEKIMGKSVNDVMKMSVDDLSEMMGIEISPTRMKCVELPLKTLKGVLKP